MRALLGTSQRDQEQGRGTEGGKTLRKIKGPKQRLRRRNSGGKHTSPVRGWGGVHGVESNDLQETREKKRGPRPNVLPRNGTSNPWIRLPVFNSHWAPVRRTHREASGKRKLRWLFFFLVWRERERERQKKRTSFYGGNPIFTCINSFVVPQKHW